MKIDAANKKILCRSTIDNNLVGNEKFSLEYDYLVIAVGAQVNTFNTPGVLENCHFLKVESFLIIYIMNILVKWMLVNIKKNSFWAPS